MKLLDKYRTDLLIVAGFVILPLLLFGPVTLGGRTMLPADNLFQWQPWAASAEVYGVEAPHNGLISDLILENYAWKRFVLNSVRQRELPLWNPYLFAGAPFLATGQHGAYYPFGLLFILLPLAKAYGWYTLSQLWLAGVSMYFFGRVLKMQRASAALAGILFQGCGFLLVSAAVFPMILGAAAWLPLLLACAEKISLISFRRPDSYFLTVLPWVALGVAGLGAHILAGHIEITYYTLLVLALYVMWRVGSLSIHYRSARSSMRAAAALAGTALLGIMLGAVQLIPLYEVGRTNFRQGTDSYAEVQSYAYPARRTITFLLPNFFGNPAHHAYVDLLNGETIPFTTNLDGEENPRGAGTSDWGIKNYVEGGMYFGILPLFLAFLGLYVFRHVPRGSRRRSHIGFFAGLGLLSLAFIFGTPLYAIIYYGLPFANQLHTPFRWVFPLSLSVAVLAGFGADYLATTRRWPRYEAWAAYKASIAAKRYSQAVWATDSDSPRLLRPALLWAKPSLITALAGASFYMGVLLWAALSLSRAMYPTLEPVIDRIFLGLAQAADAFPSARAFFSYEFRQLLWLATALIMTGIVLRLSRCPIFLRGRPIWLYLAALGIVLDLFLANRGFNAAVNPALLEHKPALIDWLQQQPGVWRLTTFSPHGDKSLNANAAWLFDLQDVRGYDSIIPRQYTEYMGAIEPQNELPFNRIQPVTRWESLNSPLLDVLGVKYIVTAETTSLPKLSPVWEGEGLHVYENLAVAPRAYTLPQASTVVVADALVALTEFDPRRYVIVEEKDAGPAIGWVGHDPGSAAPGAYQEAPVDAYSNLEVTVSAQVGQPSWLLLNDSYFPGWRAYIRPMNEETDKEREAEIVRVNGNFRGVLLEPGQWQVRFRYSPRSFQLGGLASFMAGIILLFAAVVWGWQRVVRPDAVLSTTRSIAKNSVAPVVLNLFNRSIDFVFAAYYLRVLGPADAGSYTTAIATAAIFEILSNYGLDILLMREVSQDRSKASHYLLNSSVLRLGAAVVASLPIVIFLLGTALTNNPISTPEVVAIAFIMAGMLFSGLSKGVDRLFYVYEKAEIPAAMTTVTTILKVAFGVAALLFGFGFVGLAAVSILTNIITLFLLMFLALRNFTLPGPWQLDWKLQGQMVRLGFPLMLIHLLQTIFISIDVFLLRFMLGNGEEVVGWYNSAYKWFNALQIVPAFFTLALFPIISREIKRALDAARRLYVMSLKLMLLSALPIAALTSYLAYPLVTLLAGSEFLPHGAIALQIVIWSIPIGWLNSVTNYVLIGLGLERMQPRAFVIAVCFNIIMNLLFIPRYSYVAASVTTILSEVILFILFHFYLRQKMPGIHWIELAWRPAAATALMVIAMGLGGMIHLALGLALGLFVYPAGLWMLRAIGEEERKILRSILPASIATRLRLGG